MPTALQGPPVAPSRSELWRVTDRRTFRALREEGRRARRGPLTVTWLPPAPGAEDTPPRAAFAVGRAAGGAVLRNRIRRRLRAALRELRASGRLPAGTYLVGGRADLARLPWPELVSQLDTTCREARS
ncbi:MAG: ribonuclease P protein component [Acidimicrobiales bacterium]